MPPLPIIRRKTVESLGCAFCGEAGDQESLISVNVPGLVVDNFLVHRDCFRNALHPLSRPRMLHIKSGE